MTEYIPQVGHLVTDFYGFIYVVANVSTEDNKVCLLAYPEGFFRTVDIDEEAITFLADRSAEWARLFDLNTPTP